MPNHDFDVVFVGTGVAGALAGSSLSKQGLTVAMLEAGPREENRSELMQNFYANPIKTPETAYIDNPSAPKPSVLAPHDYYIQKGPDIFNSTYERRVGGTTWHWLGTCLRLLPSDFELKSTHGVGKDWPFDYSEIEPWYGSAERELGVAGDSRFDLGAPRSSGYSKRPIAQSYLDQYLARRLAGKDYEGLPLVVRGTPQARNPDLCMGSSSCMPLCPMGAKYEAMQHIREAETHGATVIDKAVVSHVDVDKSKEISGVRYLTWDGREHQLKARLYVISANAIETPKILLMSKSKYAPNGVANSSDQVGRNLMDHPVQLSWALSKEPLYPFRGPQSTSGVESLRDGDFRRRHGAFRIEISNTGWQWPTNAPDSDSEKLIEMGLYGEELKATLNEKVSRQIQLACLTEQLPNPNNRITPSTEFQDALGLPRPSIYYQLGEYERGALKAAIKVNQAIFDYVGVSESHHHDGFFGAGHIMGTYCMGNNPATSVVDGDSRSHDHSNLFLLGSGTFPTVGSANPTLTISALSLKAVEAMKKDLS